METPFDLNKTEKNTFPSLRQAFGLLGILLLISVIASIPLAFLQNKATPQTKSLLNVLGYCISMGVLLIVAIRMRQSRHFLWRKIPWSLIGLVLPFVFSLSIIIEPVIDLIPMPDFVKELFSSLITNDGYAFFMAVIAAPLLEELIFRGVILDGFLKRYSPAKAIIWSSVLFGIAHFNPWQFIAAFAFGCVAGWLYWKTNSLIPGIVAHFFNNFCAFVMMLFTGDSFSSTQQLMGYGKMYYILYGICLAVFAVTFMTIRNKLKLNILTEKID
ncbi:MAG: CPBP family intramembrane metalloprotease [Bacteroidota bacterium]|nr:CPBP family intramembrane metalloprotease [Bacteroidota bacterium]